MTNPHEPFDDTAKAFYRHLFKSWGLLVETEREVFVRGRSIDIVVSCTDSDQARLQNSVFAHFRRLNAIELKGIKDPLTVKDYNLIMMRAWGLGALDSLDKGKTDDPRHPIRRTLTIVCVTRPDKILAPEEQFGFVPIDDGIYHCQERLEQWIIYPSELALVEKNYPLLPLARGKKLEQFISLCLHEGLKDYLQLIIDIGITTDPEVIWRKILEVKQMKPMIREDTWPIIDQFFRETPEAIVKISTIQEALADSRINAKKLGALSQMQRTLIRQLRRKFSRLPDSIVLRIQKTDDIEQLDNWLDKIISVKSLAEAKQIFEIT